MANKATSPPEHVENLVILPLARRHVVTVSIQLPQEYSTAFFLFFSEVAVFLCTVAMFVHSLLMKSTIRLARDAIRRHSCS